MKKFSIIGKSIKKIDALSLATGTEKFTADFKVEEPLHLAILYSPYAHAEIISIDINEALGLQGVVDVLYHENTPRVLFTTAGQGFPEPSPYDTYIFDKKVRFVGDRVAAVLAESQEIAREALKKIKVEYKVLKPIFDPENAMAEDAPVIHDDGEHAVIPAKYDPERNLAAEVEFKIGDVEKGLREAEIVVERVYRVQYASHCAIEPHAVVAYFDERGRLVIITTTQVPFHARRIVSRILSIPAGMIRVIKPRIGGGFGGKQEVFLEPLVAYAAWKHKRAIRLVLTRKEVFITGRTRHPMRIRMKTGAKRDGEIIALSMDALMNAGSYGPHALTVMANAGSKVLPLFNKIKNVHFLGRSVYTNLPVGGAYRGYGATQGYFAFNVHMDILAEKTNQDILEYFKRWHIRERETSEVFKALGEGKEGVSQIIKSCKLDECIELGAKEIGWYEKRRKRIRNGDRVKGVGVAIAMQGSGIPKIDMGSAYMKMNDDGSFNLHVGATDLGTGSDTILAQIAAEVLSIPIEKIIVRSSDTDLTPFDVGAYASSTTYISGAAVKKCAEKVREQILEVASKMLHSEIENLILDNSRVVDLRTKKNVSFEEIALYSLYQQDQFNIQATASHFATESPPPFVAQFAEVEVDIKTGRVYVIKFVSAVDCGQAINPILVEGQVEGAVVNGISYALWEDYLFDSNGKMLNPNFWDYKIFTAKDIPEIKTIIVNSFEETGPFGAKSVAEVAMNGPLPAIANAIYDAVGIRLYEPPFTPEKVWRKIKEEGLV